METLDAPAPPVQMRRIPIDNPNFGFGNMEAWANILRSYRAAFPDHQVTLVYESKPVQNLTYLFKLGNSINPDGFELAVATTQEARKPVAKLVRLMVEGAGPGYARFLGKELHQILDLF